MRPFYFLLNLLMMLSTTVGQWLKIGSDWCKLKILRCSLTFLPTVWPIRYVNMAFHVKFTYDQNESCFLNVKKNGEYAFTIQLCLNFDVQVFTISRRERYAIAQLSEIDIMLLRYLKSSAYSDDLTCLAW